MHRVIAYIAVSGIQGITIQRVEVGADITGQLVQIALVVVAQRGLRNGTAVACLLY